MVGAGCTNDSAVYTSFIQHRIVQTYLESIIKCTIQKIQSVCYICQDVYHGERDRDKETDRERDRDCTHCCSVGMKMYSASTNVPASSLQLSRRKQGAPRLPVKAEVGAGPLYRVSIERPAFQCLRQASGARAARSAPSGVSRYSKLHGVVVSPRLGR